MPTLGTAYVQIVPSAQGIKGSIQGILDPEAKAAGSRAGGLISSGVTKVIGAAAIGATLGKSLTEGAKLQQSIGGIETLFGKHADTMIRNADKAYRTAGISANTYMEQATSFSASLLQSVGGNTAKAAKAADMAIIDMSDNANKMGTNIQDIQNAYQGFAKQNYTMLDNLKLGYGGTKTEMERLLTDAEKLTGKKYNINNLKDVYEAIHAVQENLGIAGTSSEEAATTLSGSFASMKAAASNFLGDLTLGRNVGPAMKGLAETAATFLFDNLIPAVGNIFQSLPEAIGAFIDVGVPAFVGHGSKLVESLVTGFQEGLPKLVEGGGNLADGLVNGINAALPQVIATLPRIFRAILDGVSAVLPSLLAKGKELVVNLATGLLSNAPALLDSAGQMVSDLADFLAANLPMIAKQGTQMVVQLAQAIIDNWPAIMAATGKLALTIVKALAKVVPVAMRGGVSIAKGIAKGVGGAALGAVKAAASRVANALLSPIRSAIAKVQSVVRRIKAAFNFGSLAGKVRSAFNAVKNAMTKPIDAARSAVRSALNRIKGMFPLHIGRVFSGISLPHFSVSGGSAPWGIGGKGSMPHFSVSWYAKAAQQPYVFDKATLFGAGEAGDEVLYGRERLMKDIAAAVQSDENKEAPTVNVYMTVNGARDPEDFARELSRTLKMYMRTV